MSLAEILKRLIGNSESNLSTDAGFECSANSEGLNFYLPKPILQAVKLGEGSALQKVQLVVLNMLLEEGIAEEIANGFHISSEDVAGMDDEQADILRLPRRFGSTFTSSISGHTANSNFRVMLFAATPEGEVLARRKGPYLLLSEREIFWLTPGELMGLMAWERHESLNAEQRGQGQNLRLMAELQTAARSGMRVDLSHFDRLDVVVPENIGVTATRLPDGSLLLCPSLGDGSSPSDLEKRWSQIDLNTDGGVLRIGNRVVILDEKKIAGIKEVLGNKRIPADKVVEFMATPTAFINAALVNLDMGFSVRVSGVGKLQHMDFGSLDGVKNDWFALDERQSPPEALGHLIQTPEELDQFKKALQGAREQGADAVHFNGRVIDISDRTGVDGYLTKVELDLTSPQATKPENKPDEQNAEQKATVAVLLREADEINAALLSNAAQAKSLGDVDWARYARQPFPHQREGVDWMLRLLSTAMSGNHEDLYRLQGALLADDMGLGKTYMSLVAMGEYLAHRREVDLAEKPILVIAPLSLLENWEDEVGHTFKGAPFRDIVVLQSGRDLHKYRVKGSQRESVQLASLIDEEGSIDDEGLRYALTIGPEAGVHRLDMDRRLVLTTYQTLRDYQFSLCRIDWGMVIFDEAQNIKNPNALQTRAAKGLKADFKLLATGTPVENSLGDFWCLMDTAQPGILGGWAQFRDSWIKPILNASDEDRDDVRSRVGAELRNAVGGFMLRRVKEDQLKGLPSKTVLSGVVQPDNGIQKYSSGLGVCMRGNQLAAYDSVLDDYRSRRGAGDDMRGAALAALTELRAISLHPRLNEEAALLGRDAGHSRTLMSESGKLAILLSVLDMVRERNEKVIIFMMTRRLQRVVKLWLDQIYGLNVSVINGDTKAVTVKSEEMTRKKLIKEFEDQAGFNILIMSPVAAGVGLTVVGANHVVHLERHWNPAKEAQASDRVYRIGQTRNVYIHLPAVTHPEYDSFDVHLDRLLRGKLMLKDAVVTPEAVTETEMTRAMGF